MGKRLFLVVVMLTIIVLLTIATGPTTSAPVAAATLTPQAFLPNVVRNWDGTPVPTPTPTLTPTATPFSAEKMMPICCGGSYDAAVATLQPEVVYSWNTVCGETCGVARWPMVRDLNQLATLEANPTMLDGCEHPVLGFNEPENADCSAGGCMTLAQLVDGWHRFQAALPGHELVSPAFLDEWTGQAYGMADFLDAYYATYGVYPRFGRAAIHLYGSESLGSYQQAFDITRGEYENLKAVLDARGYEGIEIDVTETGWWCGDPGSYLCQMAAAYFLQAWIDYCDADQQCRYIAWFQATYSPTYWFCSPLLRDGALTLAGQTWVNW